MPDASAPVSLEQYQQALNAAETVLAAAEQSVGAKIKNESGRVDPGLLEQEQLAAHGYAWLATYVAGLRETFAWAERLQSAGKLQELETLILGGAFAEYLNQIIGGIALSQGEIVRPADMGLTAADLAPIEAPEIVALRAAGWSTTVRARLAELMADGNFGDPGLDDETLVLIQQQFRRFADEKIIGPAHQWHLQDELIPMPIVDEMAALGVFGLTVPEAYG
ncbi:MAG: acyl-CoA dehydrogenase family protein, partial [Alphaproteobacteria bacterium]